MSPQSAESTTTSQRPADRPAAVIVLAAGAGTRMKSRTPKILHTLGGRSMIGHALAAARGLEPHDLAVVVRHERDLVAGHVAGIDPQALLVDQDDVPGTGRAVQVALDALDAQRGTVEGTVVVTYGDVPLLEAATLTALVETHTREHNAVTVLTAELDDATGYGRIVRADDGTVVGIVEHKDATDAQRSIREVNSGIYAFDAAVLRDGLGRIDAGNAQGELYLTDVLGIARNHGGRVAGLVVEDRWQVEGANDRVQLAHLGAELNRRVLERWMRAGVSIADPASTWIEVSVQLDEDVTLLPGTQLCGTTTVARDAVVGPDTTLTDVAVGEGAHVVRTHGSGARIGSGASVGPFTYLRPGTVLGEDGKIGAFYETKNVTVGRGSKLSHLGYAGDAEIGEYTNIGCGNITANYDGVDKHRTVIGSHVRTSSNTVFVAPVQVGDGAYTGAGAVIRKDVPAGALGLSVVAQRNIPDWTAEKRPGTGSDAAARAATPGTATPQIPPAEPQEPQESGQS
ncbi:bifunctional UDP-N-acetylglucosamine diphosphorylase/glucosamine-1-phosphate N-acetyltransferase GlmU [Arthrobacter agilis]|nr:bifunctional UDP-N-acetylglucosamine diphosphorylase/glucosamine-1-phosphate N-acetyltransferase GlmU [Arthrobacter agilis]OUM40494.1 UDP-N-acetylglucosamine diphosphorylase/glucosamine-1-phosphate N-acetyltransferase [Arthrobacter agilis]PPB45106.1 bifunctional UDP-N-acetylglucosamine diphosphorylase/glucosamine-1-phosphate N-acetyltransferase GlmU [Arthrobacter agilis]TPV27811.1 bifunctional UDP-N-acetylglucosamine diphosphorylase/glucosamine-1-phosphate N-acetyltransferase GlmU [Arthrobact